MTLPYMPVSISCITSAIPSTGMRAVMRAVAKQRRLDAFRYDEAFRAVDEAMAPLGEVGK